jgi:probable HAF family extracellular repeat protein
MGSNIPSSLQVIQRRASALIAFLAAELLVSASAATYTIVDLGKYTEATAINDSGEVVGNVRVAGGNTHAFLYSNGHLRALGAWGGRNSVASGINESGEVVGASDGRGFIYSNGVMRGIDLETKPTGSFEFAPTDINASGQIAGQMKTHAAIWSHGTVVALGTLVQKGVGYPLGKMMSPGGTWREIKLFDEGFTSSERINDEGEVIGSGITSSGEEHAFLYSGGKIRDLDALICKNCLAHDINVHGEIVGSFKTEAGDNHAFLWDHGEMRDLGGPAGYKYCAAMGINASGQIVGYAYNITGGSFLRVDEEGSAFLYENGRWIDLSTRVNLAGAGLTGFFNATRINTRGQIIGTVMGSGAYHSYILTPVGANDSPAYR